MPRHRIALAALLALDLVGLVWLHGSSDRTWATLASTAPPEDAVVALLRLIALGTGWWVVASTVLYTAGRVLGWGRSSRLLRRLLVPAVRRLVEGALVASLTVGRLAPAAAEQAIPPVILIERDTGADSTRMPVEVPPPRMALPRERDAPRPERGTPRLERATATHVVRSGEHLWAIAAAMVGSDDPAHIGRYWRALVTHNRDRLRSGDPDLVFPGEVLELPPV